MSDFTRTLEAIDLDLHDQVQKRENGVNEVLHGLFVVHRATMVIDRLVDERCRVMAENTDKVAI